MGYTTTYDPELFLITVGGKIIQAWTKCVVDRSEALWKYVPGGNGSGTRNKNSNKSGTVKITLEANSPDNLTFAEILEIDESLSTGKVPILIKNILKPTELASCIAWIQKTSPLDNSNTEQAVREWIFESGDISIKLAGTIV